ncbi:MAG: penicillin-binding protein 2 [Bacteroidota bacterium]
MAIQEDIHLYQRRRTLYGVIGVLFLLLLGRLYQLQLLYSEEYGKKSEENSIRTIPREPVRGYLYDRTGRLVVDNRPAFTVTIMPFEFDVRNTHRLADMLGMEEADLLDRLRQGEAYSRFQPVKVKRDVDFRTLSAVEENRQTLPGVDYQVESKRFYTTRAVASHILGYTKEVSGGQLRQLGEGYTQGDVVGSAGLEGRYERALRGIKGAELSLVDVRGQVVGSFEGGRNNVPSVEGNDLYLTMDFDLQALAESLFTGRRGALVALDPRDGGILALVSKPDYDLSIFSGVTPPEVWRGLNADPERPLFNRATLTRYPPGSTYKMILAVAALERGVVSPEWRVQCGGSFRMGNKVFKDLHVHGSVNMTEAIQRSCNVYFYNLMLKVGLDDWSRTGAEFGFGKPTGIDIAEENPGLLPSTAFMNRRYGEKGWTRGFLPSLGIGQGELGVSPIQMACYAAALANRGLSHQPHAVFAVRDKTGGGIDTVRYATRRIRLAERTWDVVREGMRRVVMEPGGTAGLARVRGIQAAGKTGTAQNPHGIKDHSWFIGFAPYENPRIAIAVMMENVGYGGSFAAPIAGMCFEQYLYGRVVRNDPSFDPASTPMRRLEQRIPPAQSRPAGSAHAPASAGRAP